MRKTALAFLALTGLALSGPALAQGTLRIGMTASDIPLTTGQPDQGGEGQRFMGLTVYDALVHWDLTKADKPSTLIPGLAASWSVDAADKTKWIFKLREGVTFHDGSAFTAEAVVWNLDKLLKQDAPQFDQRQASQGRSRIPAVASYRAIDATTLEITTRVPDATLPYQLAWIGISSPAQWEKLGKNWQEFAKTPSGTGPWRMVAWTPRERAEMVPNKNYWDKARVPKLDKLILIPLPEPNARTAALRSGQVDWIEAPAPDAMASITARGNKIYFNQQPHVWPWQLSFAEGSPWLDKRVRQAANLCVDRTGLLKLLGGMMGVPKGTVPPGHPWWGNPKFDIRYDPEAAKKLMAEAGYSAAKPLKVKVQISASGSGQMQPLPMNEFVQQSLKPCGFDVQFDVIEWNTLFTNWRKGAKDPSANGANAINVSFAAMDPFFAMVRFTSTKTFPPVSNNWGYFGNAEFDKLIADARNTFDDKGRDAALAKLHARIVEEAPFVWIAHDVGPRAMSPKVKNVVQPRSWFIDIATMTME